MTNRSLAMWLVGIRASRMAAQFVVILVLARFFNPDVAGAMALALALSAPVFILSDLGLRTLYLTFTPRVGFNQLLRIRLIASAAAVFACSAIAFTPGYLGDLLPIVAITKAADAFVELALAPAQMGHNLHRIGWLSAGTYIGSSAAVALLATREDAVSALWLGLAIPTAFMGICALVIGRSSAQRIEPSTTSLVENNKLLRAGSAIGMSSGVLSLAAGIPQYAISLAFSTAESGRYAVVLYVVLGAELILNALTQVWLPIGAKIRSEAGDPAVQRIIDRATVLSPLFSLPVSGLLVAITAIFLPTAFGPEYKLDSTEMLTLAILLSCEPALFLGSAALQVLNRYSSALITSLAAAAMVAGASVVTVPPWGAAGGLIATTLGVLTRIFLTRRAYRSSLARRTLRIS
ncbi:lipopolysaccharide biosynthesis protein [Janibacter indicus]|uniref:Membrane protein involved in the export of O-antigen and teichoic acid n=1 Tax=Janibacter indicus TaxID=857417 RepID=A0A1W1Y559_9MICO|nr:oligosaccharide flippase family protein [Janibacter indicus]SMC31274.1 Membrane protein involved in the export of O-antigen and teichoic acid [Janibacter indicus]